MFAKTIREDVDVVVDDEDTLNLCSHMSSAQFTLSPNRHDDLHETVFMCVWFCRCCRVHTMCHMHPPPLAHLQYIHYEHVYK